MNNKLIILTLLLCVSGTLNADDKNIRELHRIVQIINSRAADFFIEIPILPEKIVLAKAASETQLESSYGVRLSLNGEYFSLPLNLLSAAINKDKLSLVDDETGDYRWGIHAIGIRGERALILAFDRRGRLMRYASRTYRYGDQVEAWFREHIDRRVESAIR
jgi:hypothetical protein